MKYRETPWVVLFGGAGREEVVTALINAGIKIKKVIVPKKKSLKLSISVSKIKSQSISIEDVDRESLNIALQQYELNPIISIGFPYIVPENIVIRHPIAINVHPTLLPKYRGPTTGAYILINNEPFSGSTVHLMDDEVDRGAIIHQSKVKLSPFDTLRSMQRKVYASEPSLVVSAINKLESGFLPVDQDESCATVYPRLRKPEDSEIDASKPLDELVNEIRACDSEDFPAYFFYKNEKLCVKLWRPNKDPAESDML